MLEDQVERYLGNYIRGLSKEALKISVWQGSCRVDISVSKSCKRTQRNVTSEASPSKRVRRTTTRVNNRRATAVTRQDGEGCSSSYLRNAICLQRFGRLTCKNSRRITKKTSHFDEPKTILLIQQMA
nr:pleckstrin homology (PH) domain-containing protein [Tanacetum cinerariifolium]